MEKEFEFEDGSKAIFTIQDGLLIQLQAIHLGRELKITTTHAQLDNNQLLELINWLRENQEVK